MKLTTLDEIILMTDCVVGNATFTLRNFLFLSKAYYSEIQ